MPSDAPVSGHDGELIRNARERMSPKMSIASAAALTGDDKGNWGHIERGYQDLGGDRGRLDRSHPPAPTLARMSSVVGVLPAEWVERGRPDVAEILERILEDARREAEAVRAAMESADEAFAREIRASPDLTTEQKEEYLRQWRASRGKVAKTAARLARRMNGAG